jgi:hypothetical protein
LDRELEAQFIEHFNSRCIAAAILSSLVYGLYSLIMLVVEMVVYNTSTALGWSSFVTTMLLGSRLAGGILDGGWALTQWRLNKTDHGKKFLLKNFQLLAFAVSIARSVAFQFTLVRCTSPVFITETGMLMFILSSASGLRFVYSSSSSILLFLMQVALLIVRFRVGFSGLTFEVHIHFI